MEICIQILNYWMKQKSIEYGSLCISPFNLLLNQFVWFRNKKLQKQLKLILILMFIKENFELSVGNFLHFEGILW